MQQIIQNKRDYKEHEKTKISSMLDRRTYHQKEKNEFPKKTLLKNEKQRRAKGVPQKQIP